MFIHKMFNFVLRSLAIVFVIAIFVPFSSSLAETKGKLDSTVTFEFEMPQFPIEDTVSVPVTFIFQDTTREVTHFGNLIYWDPSKLTLIDWSQGPEWPDSSFGWTDSIVITDSSFFVEKHQPEPGYAVTFSPNPVYILRFVPASFGYGADTNIIFWGEDDNFFVSNGIKYIPTFSDGRVGVEGNRDLAHLPEAFSLSQNYPNPFNSTTLICYQLPAISSQQSAVSLRIYNIEGQLVRTLVDGQQGAGRYEVSWDGCDSYGEPLSSGIYLCRMKATGFTQTRKVVLLK